MKNKVREQVKSLLVAEDLTIKYLAEALTERTGKVYSLSNLSAKLRRGTVTYNEFVIICDILGYDIEFKSREEY